MTQQTLIRLRAARHRLDAALAQAATRGKANRALSKYVQRIQNLLKAADNLIPEAVRPLH